MKTAMLIGAVMIALVQTSGAFFTSGSPFSTGGTAGSVYEGSSSQSALGGYGMGGNIFRVFME